MLLSEHLFHSIMINPTSSLTSLTYSHPTSIVRRVTPAAWFLHLDLFSFTIFFRNLTLKIFASRIFINFLLLPQVREIRKGHEIGIRKGGRKGQETEKVMIRDKKSRKERKGQLGKGEKG